MFVVVLWNKNITNLYIYIDSFLFGTEIESQIISEDAFENLSVPWEENDKI